MGMFCEKKALEQAQISHICHHVMMNMEGLSLQQDYFEDLRQYPNGISVSHFHILMILCISVKFTLMVKGSREYILDTSWCQH